MCCKKLRIFIENMIWVMISEKIIARGIFLHPGARMTQMYEQSILQKIMYHNF